MTLELWVLLIALTAYAIGALLYVRMAVFRAILVCRVVYVARLMTVTALAAVAVHHEPWTCWLVVAYVCEALWAWRRQSLSELRSGMDPKGAARLFAPLTE